MRVSVSSPEALSTEGGLLEETPLDVVLTTSAVMSAGTEQGWHGMQPRKESYSSLF